MSWQSTPTSPHWMKIDVNEKYGRHWKLFAQTKRYDGKMVPHYITLVAESDDDYREAAAFLKTAQRNGQYYHDKKQIDIQAFSGQLFAWDRSGADDSFDFVKAARHIQFNGQIFISPDQRLLDIPSDREDNDREYNYGEDNESAPVEVPENFWERPYLCYPKMHEEIIEQEKEAQKATITKKGEETAKNKTVPASQSAECLKPAAELKINKNLQSKSKRLRQNDAEATASKRQQLYVITEEEGEEEEKTEKAPTHKRSRADTVSDEEGEKEKGKKEPTRKRGRATTIISSDEGEEEKGKKKPSRKQSRPTIVSSDEGEEIKETPKPKAPGRATANVQRRDKRQRECSSDDESWGEDSDPPAKKPKRSGCNRQPEAKPASTITKRTRPKGWTDTEKDALATEMRLYREENADKDPKDLLHDAKLFEYMSSLLASKHGIHRSGNGCKNEWNRRGRERSGIEDRITSRSRSNSLSTSLQRSRAT